MNKQKRTPKKAKLILENNLEFEGYHFGNPNSVSGEVVFNTAMTGYPESLTDPSYKGQILVATFPLIGNYGVPSDLKLNKLLEHYESDSIQVSGLIISDYSKKYSHWNAAFSLEDWMIEHSVPGIFGIDTRELTKVLRENGTMLGKILYDNQPIDFYDPNLENLVDQVSIKKRQEYGTGKYRVLLIDCGVKNAIIKNLLKRDVTVIRVPWNYDYSQEKYDALFISNGPGDPTMCQATIKNLRNSFQKDNPIFGICLGNQLMALAAKAKTYKMKYGHRSHNQPVLQVGTDKAYITSQNHGFAVDNDTLTKDWKPNFINLNDQSSEGAYHIKKPFFSTQFHPEASSGPTDTEFLFDVFIEKIKAFKNEK